MANQEQLNYSKKVSKPGISGGRKIFRILIGVDLNGESSD